MARNNRNGWPFTMDEPKYSQSTYFGRFQSILDIIDPRMLFISAAERERCVGLLERYKAGGLEKDMENEDLWLARKVVESQIHPVSNDVIDPPFRMSAFVPINVPIVLGMLTTNSIGATIFWQWFNQTYNSAVNYENRSGADISMEKLAQSYCIATGSACGIAFGMRYLTNKGPPVFGRISKRLPGLVPYCAVALAGSANVYFTRSGEIDTGIPIFDEDGNEIGTSREAARKCIQKTILSRSLGLPLPVVFIPGLVMGALRLEGRPKMKLLAELSLITASLSIALPATLAIFPQTLPLDPKSLEPEFHNLKRNDKPVSMVYANKGL